MRNNSYRALHGIAAAVLIIFPLLIPIKAEAARLSDRSVEIASSLPGVNTDHTIKFSIPGTTDVGSIVFEYCTNDPFFENPCVAPTGFSLAGANLATQSGETGFSIDPSSTANKLLLTRTKTPTLAIPVSYTLANVVNPSTVNYPVYIRIGTFESEDGTGPLTDEGPVVFATVPNLAVGGYVPPYLTFCTGVTVTLNCSSTSGSFLNFGELSNNQARYLTSQFSVATNDPGGYATFVNGTTMTSGNNLIQALDPPKNSQPGTSQFGLNLRANSNPAIGSDPSGVGTGAIAPGFNTPNQFFFKNQVVAQSTESTDFNAYTASYIVNISASQAAGVYSTTLTYIASAAF